MAIPQKTIFIISAVLLTLLSVSCLSAQTSGTELPVPDGLEFEIVDGRNVTITKYNGNAVTVNIPARIQGLPVTVIHNSAFDSCRNLTSIAIPSSVTSIGNSAFRLCRNLTSIAIPSSVTSIGIWAFVSCYNLTSITIPSSVTFIGEMAFAFCDSLTSVTIPSSVVFIGNGAFAECVSLKSVTISRNTQIGRYAFPEMTQIIYRD